MFIFHNLPPGEKLIQTDENHLFLIEQFGCHSPNRLKFLNSEIQFHFTQAKNLDTGPT